MSDEKALTIKETFDLAVKNHQEGKTDIAQELYNQILKIDPNHSETLNNIAVIFSSLKEYQKAKECYEKAIEINPNYEDAHCNLISTLIKQSKFEEAGVNYQKVIALIPNFNNDDIRFSSDNLLKLSRLDKTIRLNPNIEKALVDNGKNLSSTNLHSLSPSPLEYEEFYREGMGTENVGSFLRALAQMVRPNRILEIGAGYTTPFLLEALINNERVFNDGNLEEAYFKNYDYAPKLVVIDDMSLDDLMKKPAMNNLITSKYIDFIEGKFEDKADLLLNKYRNFDFVWFDCGGTTEYEIFMDQYWHLCSGYVLFHFTYSNGKPNAIHNTILDKITGNPSIFDIVEPHKNRQGSITMINKHLSKIKKDTE